MLAFYMETKEKMVLFQLLTLPGVRTKKVTSYKLADGTTVYLESETSTTGSYTITHLKDTSNLRTVKMKGEARFKIVEKDSIIEYQVTSDTLRYYIQKKEEK